jgi:hypothetical protein
MTDQELAELAKSFGIPNVMRLRQLLDLSKDDIPDQITRLVVENPDLRRSYAESYKNSEGASRR